MAIEPNTDEYVRHKVDSEAPSGDRALTARVRGTLDAVAGIAVAMPSQPLAGEGPILTLVPDESIADAAAIKSAAFAFIDAGMTVEYRSNELVVGANGDAVVIRGGRDVGTPLLESLAEEIYWANFYAHTEYTSGSTFFDQMVALDGVPGRVIDLGCGDGRDSYAFAAAGFSVLGIDRSHVAVAHAGKKAEQLDHTEVARFVACDVSDVERLRTTLKSEIDLAGDRPELFYARFFLHSIPESVQEGLLCEIAALARADDWFAAEFRTDQDASAVKVHQKHYRRFQNGAEFGRRLSADFGFDPIHVEEGTGLSPYRGEDPHLYRIIANRRQSAR